MTVELKERTYICGNNNGKEVETGLDMSEVHLVDLCTKCCLTTDNINIDLSLKRLN